MGIITKEVEVRLNGNNVNYYKKLGYDIPMKEAGKSMKYQGFDYVTDFKKLILVKIKDLPLNSSVLIESTCDYCGGLKPPTKYSDYNRQTKNGTVKCCCEKCASLKHKEVMLEKYGYEGVMQVPEIKEKILYTNLERYGCKSPLQLPNIRDKITQTFYINSSQKSSKQQRYINNLYHGILNFPIKFYCADIYLPYDNIVIEFDGSGHNLSVLLGRETIDEYQQKEIARYYTIKNEGYNQVKIISTNDKLPTDYVLLQMLTQAKEYFSNYPKHSWIEYNVDTSTVRNAEQKDGVFFDYGKLRIIKDSNRIEKQIV